MKKIVIVTNASEIQVDLIPESEIDGIARAVLDAADKIMSLPGMPEKYEKWKLDRQARKRCGRI